MRPTQADPAKPSALQLPFPPSPSTADEAAARRLESSGSYRIVRRLPHPMVRGDIKTNPGRRLALLVARPVSSEIAPVRRDIGALLATYDHLGIRDIVAVFGASNGAALRALTTNQTRPTTAQLPFDETSLNPFRSRIQMVVHHEALLRPDRLWSQSPFLRSVPIVGSRHTVPWDKFGVDGTGLESILATHGYFADTQTALESCCALAAMLSAETWLRWPRSPFPYVLSKIGEMRVQVQIEGPTYAVRDTLKARGYRWASGHGLSRAWSLTLPRADAEREIAWVAGRADLADVKASISEIHPV